MHENEVYEAFDSLLWTLSPATPPPEEEPEDLVDLTPRTIAVAVVTVLLYHGMRLLEIAYLLVRASELLRCAVLRHWRMHEMYGVIQLALIGIADNSSEVDDCGYVIDRV
jgi:hypothetical protein